MTARCALAAIVCFSACNLVGEKPQISLCAADADCGGDEHCNIISGLCLPPLPDGEGLGEAEYVVGAFDCVFLDRSFPDPRAPLMIGAGVATLFGRSAAYKEGVEFSLSESCAAFMIPGQDTQTIAMGALFSTGEGGSGLRLDFTLRGGIHPGTLRIPDQVAGQLGVTLFVSGTGAAAQAVTETRAIVASGTLTLRDEGDFKPGSRLKGTIAVSLRLRGNRPIGAPCTLLRACTPTTCERAELLSADCASATCFPYSSAGGPTTAGFCSLRCRTDAAGMINQAPCVAQSAEATCVPVTGGSTNAFLSACFEPCDGMQACSLPGQVCTPGLFEGTSVCTGG